MSVGRPKNGSSGLPEWFDIEKYRAARDHGAAEWLEELTFRFQLFIGCEDCLASGDKAFKPLQAALKMLYDDPIITKERIRQSQTETFESETTHIHPEYGEYTIRTSRVTNDPMIGRIFPPMLAAGVTALTAMQKEAIEYDDDYSIEEMAQKSILHKDGSFQLYDPPLTWHGRPVIAIDPSISADILIREMRDLLRRLQKEQKPSRVPFTKNSDFIKWYNSGVLPFFDLLLWERMGNDFKGAAFVGELSQILDEPIGSEGAALKSALGYAKKLYNKDTLRLLMAQAARERQQGVEKSGKFLVS